MAAIKTKIDMESVNKVKQQHKQLIKELKDFTNNNPISIKFNNTSKKFKEVDEGFKQVTNSNNNFTTSMGHAIKRVSEYSFAIMGIYSAINQVKDGLKNFSEIDTKLSNISMITGIDKGELQGQAKLWNEQAIAMKTSTNNVADSMEEWLRAGKTIDEANERLKTNIQLSKISGETNSDVAQKLIKIGNAYNHNAKESENFANKIAFLDTQTSSDTPSLLKSANAVAEIGKQSKITEDYMLSMIATIQERSGKAPEAVARAIRGILQDLTKVTEAQDKEGKEALSKLETTLAKQGIAIRKTATEFKSGEEILKSMASKWKEFDDVTKRTIQQLAGGKSFSEEFNILMNEQNRVLDLNNQLKNSGASLQDKYAKATDNIASKQEQLKAKMEGLWLSLLNSNALQKAIDGVGHLVDVLKYLTVESKATGLAFAGLVGSLIFVTKNFKKVQFAIGETLTFFKLLPLAMAETGGMAALLSSTFKGLIASINTLFTTPAGWVFLGLATAVGVATYSINFHVKKQRELKESIEATKTSADDLNEALKSTDKASITSSVAPLKKQQDELQKLINKRKELEETFKSKGYDPNTDYAAIKLDSAEKGAESLKKLYKEWETTTNSINDKTQVLKDANVAFNEQTGEIEKVTEAKSKLETIELAEKAQKEHEEISELSSRYQELSNSTNLTYSQKQELSNATDRLNSVLNAEKGEIIDLLGRYDELSNSQNLNEEQSVELAHIKDQLRLKEEYLGLQLLDSNDKIIGNVNETGKRIQVLDLEGITVMGLADAEFQSARSRAETQGSLTNVTILETKKRITALQAEARALQAHKNSLTDLRNNIENATGKLDDRFGLGSVLGNQVGVIDDILKNNKSDYDATSEALKTLDGLYSKKPSGISRGSSGGSGYKPSGGGGSKPKGSKASGGKSASDVADLDPSIIDRYMKLKNAIDEVNASLDELKLKDEYATKPDQIKNQEKEIELLTKKKELLNSLWEKYKNEEVEVQRKLQNKGFVIENSEITNYEEKMKELINQANNKGTAEEKEKAQKEIKEIENDIKRYGEVVHRELNQVDKDWLQVTNSIKEARLELIKLKTENVDDLTNRMKDEIADIQREYDNVKGWKKDNEKDQVVYMQHFLNYYRALKKENTDILKYLQDQLKQYEVTTKEWNEINDLAEKYKNELGDIEEKLRSYTEEMTKLKIAVQEKDLEKIGKNLTDIQRELEVINSLDEENVDVLDKKVKLNSDLLNEKMKEKQEIEKVIKYLEEQKTKVAEGGLEWKIIVDKLEEYKGKLGDVNVGLVNQAKTLKELYANKITKALESQIYNGKTRKEYEKEAQGRINSIQNTIDMLQKQWELEKEMEERAERRKDIENERSAMYHLRNSSYSDLTREQMKELDILGEMEAKQEKLKEIEDVKSKILAFENEQLSSMTEEEAEQLGLESEKEKILQHQTDLKERQLRIDELKEKLANLKEQKNIQQLTQNADGTYEFKYVADEREIAQVQKELENANEEMKKETDDFNKWRKKETEKLNKDLQDKRKEYDKWMMETLETHQDSIKQKEKELANWELENQRKKHIEMLQNQINHIQNDLKIKQEFIDTVKAQIMANFDAKNPEGIMGMMDKGLTELSSLYGVKFDGILDTIKGMVGNASDELNKLVREAMSAVSRVQSAMSSINAMTASANSKADSINATIANMSVQKFDTSGMTVGEGLAYLHDKEIVLKETDTSNMLEAVKVTDSIMRQIRSINLNGMMRTPSFAGATGGEQFNINIDSVELPSVDNIDGASKFVDGIKNIARMARFKN